MQSSALSPLGRYGRAESPQPYPKSSVFLVVSHCHGSSLGAGVGVRRECDISYPALGPVVPSRQLKA